MSNKLQNWGENLSINPNSVGKDKEWDKISKRIRTRTKPSMTFWDNNVLWAAVVLMSALFAGYIIIKNLSEIKNFLGV